jgi:glycosyltransferase involved in cell wall biosynthesis
VADERIKVLRVIARLNVGGPALHVAYLTAGLAERGYDTTLVAGTLARGEESMSAVAEARGVTIETLDELHREIAPLRDAQAILRLARLIRSERPTILHTHTAKAGAVGRIAALLAGRARPPIIVHTYHGHVLRGYFNPLTTLGFRTLERWLARVTTALVAVSPEVRDDLVRLRVAPASKFTVVRLGIELEERTAGDEATRRETRRQLGVPADAFVVGWVGRMTAVKRTDDVVRALHGLVERGVDAYLCLVGDGPDRDHLERYAHELGVMKRCLFLGYQDDVGPFYSAIDALLLPSANEGTPVSVIESLAAQRPAVATRVGGTPDVIRDGIDGFLVEVGDAEAVADRLAELAADPERRSQMGAEGRARVLGRYGVERLVDDIDLLYRSLLVARARLRRARRASTINPAEARGTWPRKASSSRPPSRGRTASRRCSARP